MKLSFVIPCYRSENTIKLVVDEIIQMVNMSEKYDYEIVLVNDNSPDNVWEKIKELSKENEKIKGVSLARNFGQHAALLAGYAACTGDYVVSLDDDGQTPLDALYQLMDKIEEGYDAVYAYYNETKQTAFRRFGTWMATKMGETMLGQPKDMKGSSFYVARKFVIDEMRNYKNAYPYLWGLVLRVTRNVTCVPTEHRERLQGTSGYSFRKLLALWINGFTAFSVKPLEWGTYVGVFFAFAGFLYAFINIVRKLAGADILVGWSSMISIMLILGGIVLIMLGLIGEYVGRIYISINNAPQYVVRETTGNIDER